MHIKTRQLSGGRVVMTSPYHARPERLLGALMSRFGPRLSVAVGRTQCTAALPSRFHLSYAKGELLLTLHSDASVPTQELDTDAIQEALAQQAPQLRVA